MGEERIKLLRPEPFPNKNLPNRKETVDFVRSERLQCRRIKRKLVDRLITTKPKQLQSSDNETVLQEKYQISETESITANTQAAPPLNSKPDLHFQKEIDLLKLQILKQNKVLKSHKRQVWWKDGDIAAAITLRSISRKAYSYLRKKVGIPLPNLSTLWKWTRNVKCVPGGLEEVLTVLHAK
ncbi:hypothetical protein PR048_011912 [Dryococelus australis]|uniref:THAP9-like helix-turn-helix domain-containing protein n=1 Tax=Dryococelus australis TaxID=614101 RepID=A0ABQ9HNJ0_9NEOP|nr:hypothetical protein PR048_011912 [Dryococelus australis]